MDSPWEMKFDYRIGIIFHHIYLGVNKLGGDGRARIILSRDDQLAL